MGLGSNPASTTKQAHLHEPQGGYDTGTGRAHQRRRGAGVPEAGPGIPKYMPAVVIPSCLSSFSLLCWPPKAEISLYF